MRAKPSTLFVKWVPFATFALLCLPLLKLFRVLVLRLCRALVLVLGVVEANPVAHVDLTHDLISVKVQAESPRSVWRSIACGFGSKTSKFI